MFYASHDNNYFAKPPTCRLLCIGNCISHISSRSYALHLKYAWKTCYFNAIWHRPCSRFVFRARCPYSRLLIDASKLPDNAFDAFNDANSTFSGCCFVSFDSFSLVPDDDLVFEWEEGGKWDIADAMLCIILHIGQQLNWEKFSQEIGWLRIVSWWFRYL
jgi:hypothetical protein